MGVAVSPTNAPEPDVADSYKVSDAGVIPDDWDVSSVGSEFDIQLGKMLDAAKNIGTRRPYIGNRAVRWGSIQTEDLPSVALTPTDLQRYRLQVGDLLVCEGGEVGRAAIWSNPNLECYYQKALHRLRPKRDYDAAFLMYLLELWAPAGRLANYVTQTSIAHLTKEKLAQLPLPVPDRQEQRAIAATLSDIDGLIAAFDALILKKQDLFNGLLQQLLTGQVRLLGFDDAWEEKTLADVADVDPENLSSSTRPGYAFNYISLDDVDRGRLTSYSEQVFSSAPSRARRKIRPGDVLLGTVRPNLRSHLLFNASDGEWVCSTGFALIRCKRGQADPRFLFAHLFAAGVARQIDSLLAGSNYPAISSRDVKSLRIPMPHYDEQAAIADVITTAAAEIRALQDQREKLQHVKEGMAQELLTGRTRLPLEAGAE